MSCIVYIATKMTGRDKKEMVDRAKKVCNILRQYGITPISPVIEEHVRGLPGKLLQTSEYTLKSYWARDKYIIRRIAHVVLWDEANNKSMGCEREYALNRGVLWKPTVIHNPTPGINISLFEDDFVTTDIRQAAEYIQHNWGNRWKRWKWRTKMLFRSLPKWIIDQVYAWR